jgi:hypothetical protein
MSRRIFLSASVALLALAPLVWADAREKVQEGIVISATADMLVMTDSDGKNERAQKADGATAVTIDGKVAKLTDLAKGDKIKIAIDEDGKVVRIAATRTKK